MNNFWWIIAMINWIGSAKMVLDPYPMGENYHPKVCTIMHSYFVLLNGNQTNDYDHLSGNFGYYIHGLWAEQCAECLRCGYPTYCRKSIPVDISEFDISKFEVDQNIIKELIEYWFPPNNITSKVELIEHEYSKHGVCFQNLTAIEYFSHVIQLYKEVRSNPEYVKDCMGDQCIFNVAPNFTILGPVKLKNDDYL